MENRSNKATPGHAMALLVVFLPFMGLLIIELFWGHLIKFDPPSFSEEYVKFLGNLAIALATFGLVYIYIEGKNQKMKIQKAVVSAQQVASEIKKVLDELNELFPVLNEQIGANDDTIDKIKVQFQLLETQQGLLQRAKTIISARHPEILLVEGGCVCVLIQTFISSFRESRNIHSFSMLSGTMIRPIIKWSRNVRNFQAEVE